MIVVYAPTRFDYSVFRFFSFFGLSVHIFDKHNVVGDITTESPKNIHLITFKSEDRIGLMNIINYPPERVITDYLSSLQLEKTYQRLTKFYKGIDHLSRKLELSLVSTLNYSSSGMVYAYHIINRTSCEEKLIIINCNLGSFISHEYKIFDRKIIHILFPFGQLISSFAKYIKSKLLRDVAKLAKNEPQETARSLMNKPDSKMAVIFHKSDRYGRLFKKEHYFSSEVTSPLHWDNVTKYAVYPDENTPPYLVPLKEVVRRSDYLLFFYFIPPVTFFALSFPVKRAFLILFYRYLQYRAWRKLFNESRVRSVIIDYDLLFPKALSLALDSLGIKTFAFQERPTGSFYHLVNGVICDVYSYSGNIWRDYGEKNRSIICKESINCGSWRNYFFYDNNFEISEMRFHKRLHESESNKKVVFLGYFFDESNVVTNFNANRQFLEYVTSVAHHFPDYSILVRMKVMDEKTYQMIVSSCSDTKNIYISTDYATNALSYALCREADAIVSVQTSLAEEALAYGKKVILLDNLYSLNRMCSAIYPPDFNFLTAGSTNDVVTLLSKIFSEDKDLLSKYIKLKTSLLGDNMFFDKSDIPVKLANMLKC